MLLCGDWMLKDYCCKDLPVIVRICTYRAIPKADWEKN